jgi:formylglycine-generating enzyme required for sulfatase activity
MAWIPEGVFSVGSDEFYPEERPVRHMHVSGFWIDAHAVTVDEFRRFVEMTAYVTLAEKATRSAGLSTCGSSAARSRLRGIPTDVGSCKARLFRVVGVRAWRVLVPTSTPANSGHSGRNRMPSRARPSRRGVRTWLSP